MKRQQFLGLCASLGGSTVFAPVWAQQRYPQKAVRLVVPFLAGGNLDVTERLFAQHLDVIENSTMHAAGTPIGMSLAAVFQVFYCNVESPVHKLEHVYI
jgi:hypothetical protein